MHITLSTLLHLFILSATIAQNTDGPGGTPALPFNAQSLPLAVRSPYLNTWRPQGSGPGSISDADQYFWDFTAPANLDEPITVWFSMAVVDGVAYKLMGSGAVPNVTAANQTSVEFTPTRTTFNLTAGPMDVSVSFISPIEPLDLVRQSMPFSYMTMSASSRDGSLHSLRLYSEVTGDFLAGFRPTQLIDWSGDDSGQYVVLSAELNTPQEYTEINNHAADGTEYFAFKKIDSAITSWAITNDSFNRLNAANMGTTLGNGVDAVSGATAVTRVGFDGIINSTSLAIAVDYENIASTPEPAVWAIGMVRSPSIQYRTPAGVSQDMYPYFMTTYGDGIAAAKAFLDDFQRASSASSTFDTNLTVAGSQFSADYADLLALSARQVMGSMDITISKDNSGNWNMSDVKVFMKNMGGAGSDSTSVTGAMSVNTVDTLYAVFPMFLYLNPELGGYLLSPLLEYQDSSAYTQPYAALHIGSSYPNATSDDINNAHNYGIEETANMLIMTLAYTQRSGNGTFISKHYSLLSKWAEYLENTTLTPVNQKSADFSTADSTNAVNNQTNLALKGIIGIACMAEIAGFAGVSGDQSRFNSTATSFIAEWQNNAIASGNSHIKAFYGDDSSNGLIYNLYADKLLQLNLLPESAYQTATNSYSSDNSATGQTLYGLPLDNSLSGQTTINGMMFSASALTDTPTRDRMVSQIRSYAAAGTNNSVFPSMYDPASGSPPPQKNFGQNSPTSGAIFSLLALGTSIATTINFPKGSSSIPGGSPGSRVTQSKPNIGAIAGGVVSGAVFLGLILFGLFSYLRRQRVLENFQGSSNVKIRPQNIIPSPFSYEAPPQGFSSSGKSTTTREGLTNRERELKEEIDKLNLALQDLGREISRASRALPTYLEPLLE